MELNLVLLEGGDYSGIVYFFLMLLLAPPLLLAGIGGVLFRYKKPKAAKVLFILAGLYLVIGLGICGLMLA